MRWWTWQRGTVSPTTSGLTFFLASQCAGSTSHSVQHQLPLLPSRWAAILFLNSSSVWLVSDPPLQLCLYLGLLPLCHYVLSGRAGPLSAVNNSPDSLRSSVISSAWWSQTSCDPSSVFGARTDYCTCLATFSSLKPFHNLQCLGHWQVMLVFANEQWFSGRRRVWSRAVKVIGDHSGCFPQWGRDCDHYHPFLLAAMGL